MKSDPIKGRLTPIELAAIDLTITALQAAGHTLYGEKDDNPRQAAAEATMDLHHPTVTMSDHDREIIAQIKLLAGQLSARTSLRELIDLRSKVVQGQLSE